jgi:dipeptidase E
MKIILASDMSFLLIQGYAHTGIPKEEMRIGYVTTASKVARDTDFFEQLKRMLTQESYSFEEIDIMGKSKEELKNFFASKNVIHVEGGNTFYLLKIIRETGFEVVLQELLNDGKVYVGTSAGAYIMCPTIDVAAWNENGKDRFGITDFTALNYVPYVVKAHYTEAAEELIRKNITTLKYPLRILRDGQGIVIEDGVSTFIGKETILL